MKKAKEKTNDFHNNFTCFQARKKKDTVILNLQGHNVIILQ